MSQLSTNLRPVLPRCNHSSSSLNGMEISVPRASPWTETSSKSASYHDVKPLPPTRSLQVPSTRSSRRPSTISSKINSIASSIYSEDIPPIPEHMRHVNRMGTPPSTSPFDPPKHRSSISDLPDSRPARPTLKRAAKIQAVLPAKTSTQGNQATTHVAEQHAADYMSILPRKSKLINKEPSADYVVYNVLSTPTVMSSRVTDVLDDSLVPLPLRFGTSTTDERSSTYSNFSFLSSIISAFGEETEILDAQREGAIAVQDDPHISIPSIDMNAMANNEFFSSEQRNQITSMTPSQRGSLQQAIIRMYVTSSSRRDSFTEHDVPIDNKLPLQSYSRDGTSQAWDEQRESMGDMVNYSAVQQKDDLGIWEQNENPPMSSHLLSSRGSWLVNPPPAAALRTGQSPQFVNESSSSAGRPWSLPAAERKTTKRYSFPRADQTSAKVSSVGGKLKKVVGLEKKDKEAEKEKRREDMKKKIVVVETIVQGPFG